MSRVATLSLNPSTSKWEARFGSTLLSSSLNRSYVIEGIRKGLCAKARKMQITDVATGDNSTVGAPSPVATVTANDKFGVNERFDFLESFVDMVTSRKLPSLLVTGEGGIGKTYTVNRRLKVNGFVDADDALVTPGTGTGKQFVTIKGYSTAKGLYRTLFENCNKVIVFDDCDSILRDPVALNLLKGALDSYDKRVIHWNAESLGSDDLPRSFAFTGQVIFISNLALYKIDQAVRSRAIAVDLSMTRDQMVERMSVIVKAPEFLPEIEKQYKSAAIDFLREKAGVARELTLRSLIMVVKMASAGGNWKNRAEYILMS